MDDGHGDIALGDGPEWIGLSEAARRLGVTRAAIYGRIERRTLVTRPKGNRGLEVQWPPPQRHPDGRGNGQGDITMTVTDDVMGTTLDDLRKRLKRTESENVQLRDRNNQLLRQVADLRVEVVTAQGKADAVRAVAVADVATARAEIDAQDKLIDELKAMLADARRPWWRRWIG